MKILGRLASPRLLPLLLAVGIAAYAMAATVQDDALALLLAGIRHSRMLQALLWLVPVSQLLRLRSCLQVWRRRRQALQGTVGPPMAGSAGDAVTVSGSLTAATAERLALAGYRVRSGNGYIAAWRGWSTLPARALGCLAMASLSAGLILSIAGREVRRVPVIGGEPLPAFLGVAGRIEAVDLQETPAGALFARRLTVRASRPNGSELSIPMFPASRIGDWWYYPRFLGLAPLISFTAAEPAVSGQDFHLLTLYPPGKEDTAVIPGTPFRVVAALADRGAAAVEALQLRVLRGETLLGAGVAGTGGSLDFSGGRLTIAELRQFVTVDFVRDAGLPFIWFGLGSGCLALLACLAVRLFHPRRELLLQDTGGELRCRSLAEGRRQRHNELFHGVLDQLEVHWRQRNQQQERT